jgi:PAS domain S-box-containing protein
MRLKRLGLIQLRPAAQYTVAVGSVLFATGLRLGLDSLWGINRFQFLLFFPAVMVSGWLGGFSPGLTATLLSAAIVDYGWIAPRGTLMIDSKPDAIAVLLFVVTGALISALNAVWRRVERERVAALVSERVAREQLHAAIEAGRMGTWEFTIPTGVVKWSPGLEAIHGYAPGTFPSTFEAFKGEIHPDDRAGVLAAIGAAIEQRRDHHIEYRIVRRDGSVRWVEGRGQLFSDGDGKPERMVGVCVDVTDRKESEHALRRTMDAELEAKRQAEAANRAKDDFLAVLSHELRTPLNTILGWAAMLRSGGLSAHRAEHALEIIERNARAEARLVESLLDVSRIVAAKLEVRREPLDLGAVVDAAVDSCQPVAGDKDIWVDLDVPAAPVVIHGDEVRLQQIVGNLLANAIKFTPRRGHVKVTLVTEGGHAVIRVRDDGDGIAPDFVPHLFERFRQAEGTTQRVRGGLGLGLAIVRELVRAHDGTVSAASDGPGKGATFTVTLPIPPAVAGDITAAPEVTDEHAVPPLDGLRVLVVDDDADARELLQFTLEARGATVATAASAVEALDLLQQDGHDVMIADIGMPNEDGFTLMQKLRAREQYRAHARLPSIALTAYSSAAYREQAAEVGYDLHLAKPVDAAILARALAKVRQPAAKA